MKSLVYAAVIMTVILFGWNFACQKLPWGQGAVTQVTTLGETDELEPVPNRIRVPNGSLTTTVFDRSFLGHISFYETVEAISVIMTHPSRHDKNLYWGVELFTQLTVAIFLAAVLVLTRELPLGRQLILVACAALAASAATYGHMLNWWGLPPRYGYGACANLVVGWVVAAAVGSKLVLKKVQAVPTEPVITHPVA